MIGRMKGLRFLFLIFVASSLRIFDICLIFILKVLGLWFVFVDKIRQRGIEWECFLLHVLVPLIVCFLLLKSLCTMYLLCKNVFLVLDCYEPPFLLPFQVCLFLLSK